MAESEGVSYSVPGGRPAVQPALLMVGLSEQSRSPLTRMAEDFGWTAFEAAGCGAAAAVLRSEEIAVVVCEQHLPDGSWRSVLEEAEGAACRPHVIVASQLADHSLWGEVLNVGGYDLLAQPFAEDEVRRVVSLAWEAKCRVASGPPAARQPARGEAPDRAAATAA